MRKKSKTEIALRILEAGGRLRVSSGHEVAMSENGHLCVIMHTTGPGDVRSHDEEIGLELDWSFNAVVDEFNKMKEDDLFLRGCEMAISERPSRCHSKPSAKPPADPSQNQTTDAGTAGAGG